jgi:hypothetical protein
MLLFIRKGPEEHGAGHAAGVGLPSAGRKLAAQ